MITETVEFRPVDTGISVLVTRHDSEQGRIVLCIVWCVGDKSSDLGLLLSLMERSDCQAETFTEVFNRFGIKSRLRERRTGVKTISLRWANPNGSSPRQVVYSGYGHDTSVAIATRKAARRLSENCHAYA